MIFVPNLHTEPGQEITAQELMHIWLCHICVSCHQTGNTHRAPTLWPPGNISFCCSVWTLILLTGDRWNMTQDMWLATFFHWLVYYNISFSSSGAIICAHWSIKHMWLKYRFSPTAFYFALVHWTIDSRVVGQKSYSFQVDNIWPSI